MLYYFIIHNIEAPPTPQHKFENCHRPEHPWRYTAVVWTKASATGSCAWDKLTRQVGAHCASRDDKHRIYETYDGNLAATCSFAPSHLRENMRNFNQPSPSYN